MIQHPLMSQASGKRCAVRVPHRFGLRWPDLAHRERPKNCCRLSKVFRGKLMSALRREHARGTFAGFDAFEDPEGLERLCSASTKHRWHVYAKKPFGGRRFARSRARRAPSRARIHSHKTHDAAASGRMQRARERVWAQPGGSVLLVPVTSVWWWLMTSVDWWTATPVACCASARQYHHACATPGCRAPGTPCGSWCVG